MTVHNPNKISQLARQRFSSALMSDTKWRKLLSVVEGADLGLRQMVAKFIDVDEPSVMAFPPSLDCPHAYMDTIEHGPVAARKVGFCVTKSPSIALGRRVLLT